MDYDPSYDCFSVRQPFLNSVCRMASKFRGRHCVSVVTTRASLHAFLVHAATLEYARFCAALAT